MPHVDGLRGSVTPGDAAVVDALRKLMNGELSKAEATGALIHFTDI